jgi:hypothetical protein
MNEQLKGSLAEASAGLIYISETDSDITPFEGGPAGGVTAADLLVLIGAPADSAVEERGFDEIFARLTRVYEGAGEEQIATANRFGALKQVLAGNLQDVKVFKVGRINVDIYIVGLDGEGNLSGVKTKAVET